MARRRRSWLVAPAAGATSPVLTQPVTARGRATGTAFREAARDLIARDGYTQAKVADIAEAAGRSLGSFYNYFDSKEHLVEVLADEFKRDVDARIREIDTSDPDPHELMRELVRCYWDAYRDHAGALAAVFQAAALDPRLGEHWRSLRADARRQIASSVRWMQDLGGCPGLDPDATASAIGSMLDYFCYVWLIEGGEQGADPIDDDIAIDTLAEIWFRALSWRDEPPKRTKKRTEKEPR